jgi:transcriptional regulator with XRE-family HTH domain
MADDPWKTQLEAFGSFVRAQRQLAKLSLREMAELAMVSNPYLSQIERGLHEPSIRVIKAIAKALDIPAETLLAQVGLVGEDNGTGGRMPGATELAVSADPHLSDGQKQALLAVYRSYVAGSRTPPPAGSDSGAGDATAAGGQPEEPTPDEH